MSQKLAQTLQQGYEKFVVKNSDGCWGWSGCAPVNPGYGQFRSEMKLIRAHRASWIINFGEIPKGMFVLHKCDNPICSRPDHLFLGTQKDNLRDMISKKRNRTVGVKGEKSGHAKLTDAQVSEIRTKLKSGIKGVTLANLYNVCTQHISAIKKGYAREAF